VTYSVLRRITLLIMIRILLRYFTWRDVKLIFLSPRVINILAKFITWSASYSSRQDKWWKWRRRRWWRWWWRRRAAETGPDCRRFKTFLSTWQSSTYWRRTDGGSRIRDISSRKRSLWPDQSTRQGLSPASMLNRLNIQLLLCPRP